MAARHDGARRLPGAPGFPEHRQLGQLQPGSGEPQPLAGGLSHGLKKLEDELGVKLVARTTRQVALTPAGVDLLPSAQRIVEELSQLFGTLRSRGRENQDVVRIGCLPTIASSHLLLILQAFDATHPDVLVRIIDHSATAIVERVRAGDAEFGITIMAARHYDLDIAPIHQEPFVAVCPAGHPLAAAKAVTWSELRGETLIKVGEQTGNNLLIAGGLGGRYADMRWRYEVHRVATAVGMVLGGLGITVVPRPAFQAARGQDLVAVPLRAPSIARTIGIVTRRGHTLSPPAEHLARLFREHFQSPALCRGARSPRRLGLLLSADLFEAPGRELRRRRAPDRPRRPHDTGLDRLRPLARPRGRARSRRRPRLTRCRCTGTLARPARLLTGELRRLGNNLNQITRRLNTREEPAPPSLEPLLREIRILLNRGPGHDR